MSDFNENKNEIESSETYQSNTDNVSAEESVEIEKSKESFNLKKEVLEWIYTIVTALIVVIVIKGFIFDIVTVDGSSMEQTLSDKDMLIVTKLAYKPEQFDVIILDSRYADREEYYASLDKDYNAAEKFFDYYFNLPENLKKRYYVKRIIALPGQTVDIKDGKVLVDGEVLDEPYYDGTTPIIDPTVKYPLTVDENCVFVMGDNRHHSTDSRASSLGQVPYDAIFGKAQIRFWPLNDIELIK